jgi:hypothetical protein
LKNQTFISEGFLFIMKPLLILVIILVFGCHTTQPEIIPRDKSGSCVEVLPGYTAKFDPSDTLVKGRDTSYFRRDSIWKKKK